MSRIILVKHENNKTYSKRVMDFIDLCAKPIRVSRYLERVNPLLASHKLQSIVVDVWDEKNAPPLILQTGKN
jgi:hypothetical protein